MNTMKNEMEVISDVVLSQLKKAYMNHVDVNSVEVVLSYALKNKLLRLAGWISWNGHWHYAKLLKEFESSMGAIPVYDPPKPQKQKKVRKSRENFEDYEDYTESPEYYVDRIRRRIRGY